MASTMDSPRRGGLRVPLTLLVCGVASALQPPATHNPHQSPVDAVGTTLHHTDGRGSTSVDRTRGGNIPDGVVTIKPPYTTQSALTSLGNPRGTPFVLQFETSRSRIFNGSDPSFRGAECGGPTPGECCHKTEVCAVRPVRNISVYIPPQLKDRAGMPAAKVIVMQDGPQYFDEVSYALDNLGWASPGGSSPLLPPFVVVSVQNGGSDAIKSERGLEYDTMSGRYGIFLNTEILPFVEAAFASHGFPHLRLSTDPADKALFGCSSGGAAAFSAAWFTESFSRVAAYSATLVDQQDHGETTGARRDHPFGGWEYHSSQQLLSTTAPRKPLRIFHHNSEFDLGYNCSAAPVNQSGAGANGDTNNTAGDPLNWNDGHHNWKVAGERTAVALQAGGYPFRHVYSEATHHCDPLAIRASLADTLVWLWQAAP